MRTGWALALAVLALSGAQAGAGISLEPSRADLALHAPVTLAAGPDGSTTLGANATSARSTVTGGTVAATTWNASVMTSHLTSAHRVRLRLLSASNVADCVECTLQLRWAGTTSAQVSYVNGAPSGSTTGPWVTLPAGGSWAIYAVARAKVVADEEAVLTYALDVAPAGSDSPLVEHHGMRTTFRV